MLRNDDSIQANGLVGWWRNGLVIDRSANNHNGDFTGRTSLVASGKIGGMAYDFITYSTWIECGVIDITGFNGITLSAWFRMTTQSTGRIMSIKHSGGDDIRVYCLSDKIICSFDDGAFTNVEAAFTDTENWHHFATTYDGTTVRLYLDGSEVGTPSVESFNFASADGTTQIGRFTGDNFLGYADDARVYDRAVSPNVVRQMWLNPNHLVRRSLSMSIPALATGAVTALTPNALPGMPYSFVAKQAAAVGTTKHLTLLGVG